MVVAWTGVFEEEEKVHMDWEDIWEVGWAGLGSGWKRKC